VLLRLQQLRLGNRKWRLRALPSLGFRVHHGLSWFPQP
jgi:hypothetical protein